jgi:hypothetical protein
MKYKVKMNQGEMMEILDPLHQNAYDKLQGLLERKLCEVFSEKAWLKSWGNGDFEIEMTLTANIQLDEEETV